MKKERRKVRKKETGGRQKDMGRLKERRRWIEGKEI